MNRGRLNRNISNEEGSGTAPARIPFPGSLSQAVATSVVWSTVVSVKRA